MDNSEREHAVNEAFHCNTKVASYSCKQCHFKTELKIILNTQILNNCQKTDPFNERNYMCNNCNFTSYSILLSSIHQRSPKCDNRLKQHKLEPNSDKNTGNSSCKFCEYKSSVYGGLKKHYFIDHPDEMYKCKQCHFKTTRKIGLMKHIREHHTDREHHTEEIKWYECSQCNYKAKRKYHLNRHIEGVHTDKANRKMYECSQCSFKTICKSWFYFHKRKHSKFKHQCMQCLYQTFEKSKLKKHINSRHAKLEEIKWFYCDQCDFKTKHKSSIGPHIAAKHSKGYREKIYRYKCSQCSYKTNRLPLLRDHRITKHTDPSKIDHWYECNQCDYKAKIKTTFRNHIRRRHGGTKN